MKHIIILFIILSANLYSQLSFKNLGEKVNSKLDEFLPVVYNDTLYFLKDKDNSKIYRRPLYKLKCNIEATKWEPKIKIYNVNGKNPNGTERLFLTSSPSFYMYSDSISTWEIPEFFQIDVNSNANDLHPCFSITGDTIIFSSDRPLNGEEESNKTLDLFIIVRKTDGTWSLPKNLGKNINTIDNEIAPYIAPNGDLYFSSDGYRKKGPEVILSGNSRNSRLDDIAIAKKKKNFDILYAQKRGGVWLKPVLIEFPVNTDYDEVGYATYQDYFYIASNRPSSPVWGEAYGGFDLYGFCDEKCCDSTCKDIYIVGQIGGVGYEKISSAKVEVYDTLNKTTIILNTYSDGEFNLQYQTPVYLNIKISHPCLNTPLEYKIYRNCNFCEDEITNINAEIPDNCPDLCDCNKEINVILLCTNKIEKKSKIEIFNTSDNRLVKTDSILSSYSITLDCDKDYEVRIFNKCLPNGVKSEKIYKDSEFKNGTFKSNLFIELNEKCCELDNPCDDTFELSEDKVPFFVTGYYHLNTKENYRILKDKLGTIFLERKSETLYIDTSRIRNDNIDYEKSTGQVEAYLNDVISKIASIVDRCENGIDITVSGYCDDRNIDESRFRYIEESIPIRQSEIYLSPEFTIEGDRSMNNYILSHLRAYFSAEYLYKRLERIIKLDKFNKINWKAVGKGISYKSTNNAYNRRIEIQIKGR